MMIAHQHHLSEMWKNFTLAVFTHLNSCGIVWHCTTLYTHPELLYWLAVASRLRLLPWISYHTALWWVECYQLVLNHRTCSIVGTCISHSNTMTSHHRIYSVVQQWLTNTYLIMDTVIYFYWKAERQNSTLQTHLNSISFTLKDFIWS